MSAAGAPAQNILLVMADQFSAHVLEHRDGTDGHFATPNLDRLVGESVVFPQAYTSFPLCVPARSSMVTGRYPHQLGITGNDHSVHNQPGQGAESLGHWFAAHGYDCAYAGKWHAPQPSAGVLDGFDPIHAFGDVGLVEACTGWLAGRTTERPFLLVASFDDPHTICEYARRQPLPYGNVPPSDVRSAPPLPANHHRAAYAPEAPVEERRRASTVYGTLEYGPDDWRRYRQAYAALVARVDGQIGALLDAVEGTDTAVVFLSDHGDGDASHGWNQKTSLIQESIRVPLLIRSARESPRRIGHPVPAALALLPTLCHVAGIDAPPRLPEGSMLTDEPSPVVVQTRFAGGPGPETTGRSLLSGAFKYTVYSWGRHREQLHDLAQDPGEQRNLAVEAAYDEVLEEMRCALLAWCLETGDDGFLKRLILPAAVDPAVRAGIFAVPY
ncbi:sulfatase family protein [Pseudarthrobacter sp. P1]|uniref:sulfatase family protein n=1 Tax=Pseudarthrobacter sp. P1 TaxID=3418418 RepID=UPI003CFA73D5